MYDPTLFTLSESGVRVVAAREADGEESVAGAFELVNATARTAASLYRLAILSQRRAPTWLLPDLEEGVLPSLEVIETIWLESLRRELHGAGLAETDPGGLTAIDFIRRVRSTGQLPTEVVEAYDADQCVSGMLLVVSAGVLEMSAFSGADPRRLLEIVNDYAADKSREDRAR